MSDLIRTPEQEDGSDVAPAVLAFTPEEVGAMWRVPTRTIDELIRSGDLAAVRVGRHRRITPAAAEDYLSRCVWRQPA